MIGEKIWQGRWSGDAIIQTLATIIGLSLVAHVRTALTYELQVRVQIQCAGTHELNLREPVDTRADFTISSEEDQVGERSHEDDKKPKT
jgi:hypothetical protein